MDDGTKVGAYIPVSQSVLDDSAFFVETMARWRDATPEQRAQWTHEAAERREAQREAAGKTELSVGSICAKFGWTYAYALHFVQDYCTCGSDSEGGWDYCQHAYDLGLAD